MDRAATVRSVESGHDGVVVRPARVDELAAVGELTVAAYRGEGSVPPFYEGVLRDAAERAGAAELLVAVDGGGTLLGTVTFCLPGTPFAEIARPGEAEFRMLATDPAARGRGVGETLVRAVLARAGDLGRQRVVLSCSTAMPAAQRLYRRLGFRRLPDRDWSPADGVQLLAFAYPLDPHSAD